MVIGATIAAILGALIILFLFAFVFALYFSIPSKRDLKLRGAHALVTGKGFGSIFF